MKNILCSVIVSFCLASSGAFAQSESTLGVLEEQCSGCSVLIPQLIKETPLYVAYRDRMINRLRDLKESGIKTKLPKNWAENAQNKHNVLTKKIPLALVGASLISFMKERIIKKQEYDRTLEKYAGEWKKESYAKSASERVGNSWKAMGALKLFTAGGFAASPLNNSITKNIYKQESKYLERVLRDINAEQINETTLLDLIIHKSEYQIEKIARQIIYTEKRVEEVEDYQEELDMLKARKKQTEYIVTRRDVLETKLNLIKKGAFKELVQDDAYVSVGASEVSFELFNAILFSIGKDENVKQHSRSYLSMMGYEKALFKN